MVFEIQSVHFQLDLSTDTSYFLLLSTNPTALGRYKHLKNPQNIFSTFVLFLGAICNSSACAYMCIYVQASQKKLECVHVQANEETCHPLWFAQAHSEKQPHCIQFVCSHSRTEKGGVSNKSRSAYISTQEHTAFKIVKSVQ